MSKPAKIFLTLCIVASVAAFTTATSSLAWGLAKPLGAVFFILFFIFQLLEKEFAQLDADRAKLVASRKGGVSSAPPSPGSSSSRGNGGHALPAGAH